MTREPARLTSARTAALAFGITVACAAVGLGTGFAGFQVNGGMIWFIAIPVILGVGRIVFADPAAGLPSQRRGPGGGLLAVRVGNST